tara:strand:+ start:401 stop:568 length:168 start_codon:yes stop_codon:yes gene_type:complete
MSTEDDLSNLKVQRMTISDDAYDALISHLESDTQPTEALIKKNVEEFMDDEDELI